MSGEARARRRHDARARRRRAFADHPAEYAADADRPGIAYVGLQGALPDWLTTFPEADAVLVMPHWGPNMTAEPTRYVRRNAHALLEAGATIVAGHSAHVFHGVAPRVLYDLGDFLDDYRVDRKLRNDLGACSSSSTSPASG